jgi:hypothetical protein
VNTPQQTALVEACRDIAARVLAEKTGITYEQARRLHGMFPGATGIRRDGPVVWVETWDGTARLGTSTAAADLAAEILAA